MELDSYIDAGVLAAVGLVNTLMSAGSPAAQQAAVADVLAVDPPSVAQLRRADLPRFTALATELRAIFGALDRGDTNDAAQRLNTLLAAHPAHPHLAQEDGVWRMHHHPIDATLVPMWTAICAEAMARMIGAGHGDRFGLCGAQREGSPCGRAFFDLTKNGSRRFCSTTCQNRSKTAAFRERQAAWR